MTPQQLKERAGALDALRPGRDGDGFDSSVAAPNFGDGSVRKCSFCRNHSRAGHRPNCRNVALSAALHDGAQALRREAAMIDYLQQRRGYHNADAIVDQLAALHADPAGQEQP